MIVLFLVLLFASITTWGLLKFYNFITSVLPFSGWISIFLVIGVIYMIFKYRKNISINKLAPKKTWWKGILGVAAIVVVVYFILHWWNNRPTSPDTPTQYGSHSIRTGTLQTQNVSTASATVPAQDMRLLITLGEKYTWQPGAVYVWKKEPVQKYFLPVDCDTRITVFVYTEDRSSHYMYQAYRDSSGKVSYTEYDHIGTMPNGYVKAKLIGDTEVTMKYTAYLK
jgi:hypothetical protein